MGMETAQQVTQDFLIELAPQHAVDRAALEAAALDVQDKLDEYTNDITHGASASANFANGTIEIDLTVVGYSPGEFYQRIGIILDRLAKHCQIAIAADQLTDKTGVLGVRSVASQMPVAVA